MPTRIEPIDDAEARLKRQRRSRNGYTEVTRIAQGRGDQRLDRVLELTFLPWQRNAVDDLGHGRTALVYRGLRAGRIRGVVHEGLCFNSPDFCRHRLRGRRLNSGRTKMPAFVFHALLPRRNSKFTPATGRAFVHVVGHISLRSEQRPSILKRGPTSARASASSHWLFSCS